MTRRIVILNGSPRANGNTAALVEDFARGACEQGAEIDCFDLQRMCIHPCLGCCRGGGDPGHPCVQRDDMDRIYPAYREADLVALASPLYYWTVSGQLKCAFDRLFAVAECDPGLRNPRKECALLMAAEGDGFEEVERWYGRVCRSIGWTDRGRVLAGGVFEPGDIAGSPKLAEAYELGRSVGR